MTYMHSYMFNDICMCLHMLNDICMCLHICNDICMCLHMFNDICMCLYMFTAISKITSLTCINLWCKEKMVFKDIRPFK